MHEKSRPIYMPQEFEAKPFIHMGSLDQPRDVGDDDTFVAGVKHAEVW